MPVNPIELMALAKALTAEPPSKADFWDLLGQPKKVEYSQQREFAPSDSRFERIEVVLDRNGTPSIEYVELSYTTKAQPTVAQLEKVFGPSKAMTIGPSDPRHRGVAYSTVTVEHAPYGVFVYADVDGYEVKPSTPVPRLIFRRDKRD